MIVGRNELAIRFMGIFEVDRAERLLAVLLLMAFSVFVARWQGVLPAIMADEWHYSLLSRLLPFSQSDDPGFAYLGLYEVTNVCAGGYLGCARLLNTLFYLGGCLLVFLSARHFLSPAMSLGVVALAVLAPESVYTLFFMPESMYFFMFWAFAFVVLGAAATGNFSVRTVGLCGVVLALVSLVKPHAVFLVLCFGFYLMVVRKPSETLTLRYRFSLVLTLVATFLGIKFLLGFFAAGQAGVTIFGSRYSNMASQNITIERVIELFNVSGKILITHFSLLMFVFFIPLFGALNLLRSSRAENEGMPLWNLSLFVLFVLMPLLAVTAVFSASVAGTNPYDVIDRVHMRYYNFSIPMLIIMAGVLACNDDHMPMKGLFWNSVICLSIFLLGAFRVGGWLDGLQINWVDSPGLMFMMSDTWVRITVLTLALSIVVFSLYRLQWAARLYLLVFLPVVFLADTYAIQKTVEVRKKPDTYDAAGIALNALLAGRANEQVTLFGPDESLLYRVSFYLDRPNTAIRVMASKQYVDSTLVPVDATQVLVFGDEQFQKLGFEMVLDNGFKLFSLRKK